MASSHHWIEQTAELRLELHAPSQAGVFRQALTALRELLAEAGEDPGEAPGATAERPVEVEATDRAALLAEWLAELVFLAGTEGLVPEDVRDLVVSRDAVTGVVRGRLGARRHPIRAVSYQGMELRRDPDGWRGTVVLDI